MDQYITNNNRPTNLFCKANIVENVFIVTNNSNILTPNSSFTDFPLIKLPPETDIFLLRTLEVAPRYNTGYSYAHAHIAQIKITREHCVHATDHSGWRFSTMHVIK